MRSKSKQLPKLIVILGPTASGKTTLAVKLAKRFSGEIVSADSRQIYRGMDIGTAKPESRPRPTAGDKPLIVDGIPHWLMDIREPDKNYTVAEFKDEAVSLIKDIRSRGKNPILCGGTGLYIEAVVKNLEIPRVPPDPKLRKSLEKELKKNGADYLYRKLIKLDPEAAYIIDPKNGRRIIRALEVMLATKKPFTAQRKIGPPIFNVLEIGLRREKGRLRRQIDERVDLMMKLGLVKEVKRLIRKYPKNLPAFDAIGYREIIQYLDGKIPRNEAVGLIKKNTWRFGRRQMSWFRRDKAIRWVKTRKEAKKLVRKFLVR